MPPFKNMGRLSTVGDFIGREATIMLFIKPGRYVTLNPDQQEPIWKGLRGKRPLTIPEVFDRVMLDLRNRYPGIRLSDQQLDLPFLVDYIFFLRGSHPWNPQVTPVTFTDCGPWGTVVGVPQGNGYVYVNFNTLRFIYNEHKAGEPSEKTIERLRRRRAELGEGFVMPNQYTIRRIRFAVLERFADCPLSEQLQWEKVMALFVAGEPMPLRDEVWDPNWEQWRFDEDDDEGEFGS